MSTTADPLDGLLAISEGYTTARWNFPAAVGSQDSNPAGIGTSAVVTYSFLESLPGYAADYSSPIIDFAAFDETLLGMRTAARAALASIADFVDVIFVETPAGQTGQITFGLNSQPGSAGYAYYPAWQYFHDGQGAILEVAEAEVGGDVWIEGHAIDWVADDFFPGNQGYAVLLHEIGHALGLKHPFEGNITLDPAHDVESFTMMSYTAAPSSIVVSSLEGGFYTYSRIPVSSLMPGDIVALQYLYGANEGTATGDDLYRWGNNAAFYQTIWDGGGSDTIDCSNQTLGCNIDLRPGAYSSIGLRSTETELLLSQPPELNMADILEMFGPSVSGALYDGQHNLAIAAGVVIERAIGGSAADSIIGNDFANSLYGNLGNDSLLGGGGADLLDGGRGADQMDGGSGNDLYIVDHRFDQISELSDGGIDSVSARAGHVLADNVENLFLTGSDTLRSRGFFGRKTVSFDLSIDGTGNASDNLLRGNRGHNELEGLGGNDTLLGGAGADVLHGGTGADRLVGGAGPDVFVFAAGDGGAGLAAADMLYDFENGIDRIALAGGLSFSDLTISQGNGSGTAAGNTVIGTNSGEYLVVLLNTSASAIAELDFLLPA
ncbi:MAG: M10 family metallopeptidase C-terminal domain-containing protein [Sulfuritalea sp.]|nr:M10 family metallopeptidase C-terminal domain-containing protein [Sulfuritalea sp.]